MSTDKRDSLIQRVQDSYRQLSVAATTLNNASDRLGTSVAALDSAIKKLNLGISAWVHFQEWHSEDGFHYADEDIGYAKIGGKWGLSIRSVEGNEAEGPTKSEVWTFNEAPRALRVRAVPKIPDLLEKLVKEATNITKTVDQRVGEIDLLTDAISSIPDGSSKPEASSDVKRKRQS